MQECKDWDAETHATVEAERGTRAHELAEELEHKTRRAYRKSRMGGFIASMLAMGGASMAAMAPPVPALHAGNRLAQGTSTGNNPFKVYAKPGPGHRAVKRAAAKRRNVLRNKRAHRGGR